MSHVAGGPWLGYVICLFLIYTCMSLAIQQTSATTVNISILSADFYALLFGLFLFHYKVRCVGVFECNPDTVLVVGAPRKAFINYVAQTSTDILFLSQALHARLL